LINNAFIGKIEILKHRNTWKTKKKVVKCTPYTMSSIPGIMLAAPFERGLFELANFNYYSVKGEINQKITFFTF